MKTRMRRVAIVLVLAVAWGAGTAAAQEQRGPSTPEERARFVQVAHKVEANPLDPALKEDARWALKWITDVPDIEVSLCPAPLGGLIGSHSKYEAALFGDYALALGAFVIEHPDKAKDEAAVNLAGVTSALKAYQAILKQDPKATSAVLKKQAKGELGDFVQKATREQCKEGGGTS